VISAEGPLLRVADLRVSFPSEDGEVPAVDGVSLALRRGRTLGIVGESGSGKSTLALTLLGLTRAQGAKVSGRVQLGGRELTRMDERALRTVRGNEMAMIFQEPLSSLHPMYRVGAQIVEAIRAHRQIGRKAARARAIELLRSVGIPDPAVRVDAYPHELSGGQRQRAMIAMALCCDPAILIADEPTSALDVTVQAQILKLLARLVRERQMALVLVTHDLGVVAEMADEISVMRAGKIVERAPARQLLTTPEHPYTVRLLQAIRDLQIPRAPARQRVEEPLLRVTGLVKEFAVDHGVMRRRRIGAVRAVDGIELDVLRGETFGIVGESGSGKTTTARLIARLLDPTAGEVRFAGQDITALRGAGLKRVRRELQIVFQDPYSSLNPRRTIGTIVGEPLAIHRIEPGRAARRRRAGELLETVGLDPA
jgi:peptide/nickel transport system ATP-binding protein